MLPLLTPEVNVIIGLICINGYFFCCRCHVAFFLFFFNDSWLLVPMWLCRLRWNWWCAGWLKPATAASVYCGYFIKLKTPPPRRVITGQIWREGNGNIWCQNIRSSSLMGRWCQSPGVWNAADTSSPAFQTEYLMQIRPVRVRIHLI